ncbi:hypothetical protein BKA62DRAFT_820925 [Auriculariales sp. MPI-PUGE-AT-0066]|nr:hypothetical protein BKA62DRAFT_820925 [Auriculariales sp. MPI-PUGE-AT-0066]
MGLLGDVLDTVTDTVEDTGDTSDVVNVDVVGVVSDLGNIVTDAATVVGEVVTGVATVLGKILVADTDTSSTPTSTNSPNPAPTATSSSSTKPPPSSSTTTKMSLPVGPNPGGDDGSSDSDDDESDNSGVSNASTLPSSSNPGVSLPSPSSSATSPAGNAGSTPSLPSPSSTSPSEDPEANPGKHHNTALVASLATIGALLALLALLCLVRRYFIVRRRTRRDAWARRPTDFAGVMGANYGSYDEGKSFGIVARVDVERQDDSPEPRSADMPSGWVDVEKADPVSPPRPLFVTNHDAVRQSGISVESYGNLTREPLMCYRPSGGYASSLSSGTSSVTVPPAVVVASRWSASQETSSGAHGDTDSNTPRSSVHSLESSESEKSESARLVDHARLSLAYLRQSTSPQPEVHAPVPSPTRRTVDSALITALFTPVQLSEPTPALARTPSVKSVPHISIYASNEALPSSMHASDSPRSPSWTAPESWSSAPSSPVPGQTGFRNPQIVITRASHSPREPRSASGLFVDADPFASPLDHA